MNSTMPGWATKCLEMADESPAFTVRQSWDAVRGSVGVALQSQQTLPAVSAIESKLEHLRSSGLLSDADFVNACKLKSEAEIGTADSERAKSLILMAADLCERLWNGSET